MTARRRPGRAAALTVAVLAALVLAGAVALAARQRPEAGVLDGVHVDGRAVAGLSRDALAAAVADRAQSRLDEPVTVKGDHEDARATRGQLGADFAVDAVVADAWSRGRRAFPGSVADHVRALFGAQIHIRLDEELDESTARAWAQGVAEAFSRPARPAALAIVATASPPGPDEASRVVVTDPAAGEHVDGAELGDRLVAALRDSPSAIELPAPAEVVPPVPAQEDLDAVVPLARTALSGAVRLIHPLGGPDVVLSPAEIAAVLRIDVADYEPQGRRLRLLVDADGLTEVLGADRINALRVLPVEATFRLVDGAVVIDGGESGFAYDAEAAAAQLLEVAAGTGPREAELPGRRDDPELTRAQAEALGIDQPVSTFTTEHPCCQPRVTNIQRFADLVHGAVIKPGERFSLNDDIGPRTEERGFVGGGVIVDGEFSEAVGGGVSQFATTFFNAAFFSGIRLVQFQPHSYYISRYPAGRESTIHYGLIDVVVENDSPYGILVETSYTETSITVTLWSTPWAEVAYRDMGRTNVRPGRRRDGFTIRFFRDVTYPDGRQDTREWTHHYQPED